jgi:hypothetical protein
VQGKITHPLQVTGGADRGHHAAQVTRHRCVEQQDLGRRLLDLGA